MIVFSLLKISKIAKEPRQQIQMWGPSRLPSLPQADSAPSPDSLTPLVSLMKPTHPAPFQSQHAQATLCGKV